MTKCRCIMALSLAGMCILLASCVHVGPANMTKDRFDYSESVGDSWKSQMLLNLVKIRYGDAPVFLDIGQIVAGYSLSRTVGATAGTTVYNGGRGAAPTSVLGSLGLAAGETYNVSPTVTYSPMSGERFARSLMTPVPPSVILNLIQGGDPIDEVFRISVQSINDVDNRRVGRLFARRANPEFYVLLPNLARLQGSGDIGMRIQQVDKEQKFVMVFRPRLAAAEERALANVTKILGLDPSLQEFPVVYGNVESSDKEIALLTRSINEILTDMASYVSVPEEHVAEGKVRPTPDPEVGPDGPVPPLIRVSASKERPGGAFVSVPYEGYWFSIDDKDLASKQMLSSIMFLFTFVETGSKEAAPILTIPTTR
jgi:hypothetical protein